MIPDYVVLEFLGNVSFSLGQMDDVYIAEQIASQSYNSMVDLCDVVRGQITHPKYLREFEAFEKDLHNQPYFKPYLNQ